MRATIAVVLLFVLLGSAGQAPGWQPSGWVYHMYPYQYAGADSRWHYLYETNDMGVYNYSAKTWSRIRDIGTTWILFDWPYAYVQKSNTWYFMDSADLQWSLDLTSKQWSRYGQTATVTPVSNSTKKVDLDRFSWTPTGANGTTGILVGPLRWSTSKIGMSGDYSSDFLGKLTPRTDATYSVTIPARTRLIVQFHSPVKPDGKHAYVLEYNFDPRYSQTCKTAKVVHYSYMGIYSQLNDWPWQLKANAVANWFKYQLALGSN